MNPANSTLPASPLIQADALRSLMHASSSGAPAVIVLDASFDLSDPGAGRAAWAQAHIPSARHADLEGDLCGSKRPGAGRHPLPERATFARTAGAWGITPQTPVVVYDRQGSMYAARLWWMLRWLGHRDVRVLDGGWSAWVAAEGAVATAAPGWSDVASEGQVYPAAVEPAMPVWDAVQLAAELGRVRLIDARAPERFRGDVEPLDPVAGHIPGAVNRPFLANLDADRRFLPPAELRVAFAGWAAGEQPIVQQCGSGVTACHNLLAMEVAGFGTTTLYAGSWSEWCSDPSRPVARG